MRYVWLFLALSVVNPVIAVNAQTTTTWRCYDEAKCEGIRLHVPYGPPTRVKLACQKGNDVYQPPNGHVDSQNLFVTCGPLSGVDGNYKYSTCNYAGTTDPKVNHFQVVVGLTC